MNLIEQNKGTIIPHLIQWAETFNPENIIYNKNTIKENGDTQMYDDYESILKLIERLENNQSTKIDYENILFHIDQINYNKDIIIL